MGESVRWPGIALNEGRGVNPGDTYATIARLTGHSTPLNEGRGVNPGDTRQDVSQTKKAATARLGPLNEGRGVNPGDTAILGSPIRDPRGDGRGHVAALNEGRGVNPGDTPIRGRLAARAPATRSKRSTKAGA